MSDAAAGTVDQDAFARLQAGLAHKVNRVQAPERHRRGLFETDVVRFLLERVMLGQAQEFTVGAESKFGRAENRVARLKAADVLAHGDDYAREITPQDIAFWSDEAEG
jgi:hypothetical protein